MPATWKVTYTLTGAVGAERHPGYPGAGLSFLYDEAGALIGIEHELVCPDTWTEQAALATSAARLAPMSVA